MILKSSEIKLMTFETSDDIIFIYKCNNGELKRFKTSLIPISWNSSHFYEYELNTLDFNSYLRNGRGYERCLKQCNMEAFL